jgi:two-component system, chemotaxis family, CheB/CheR fusion protein
VVCSICTQTIKTGSDQEEISRNMIGRIQAVSSAQDFLSIASNEGSELRGLIEAIIGPLCPNPARLEIAGTSVILPPDLTTSFALILHELATNAVKYGAWQSNYEGKIAVAWRRHGDRIWFHWREHGVKLLSHARRGFGSKVIQQSLHGACVSHSLHPDGAECTISLSLSVAARQRCDHELSKWQSADSI